jgi:hypothetical protein
VSDRQVETPPADCGRCNGTGKLRYEEEHLPVQHADGTIVEGRTSGTRPCRCVRDLPAIEGDASWWNSEVVWESVFNDSIGLDEVVEISVCSEVPRREDGRRVQMLGNRCYPTMVELHLPSEMLMHPFQLRDLALKLLAAVAAAEAIDDPCQDACGHWFPCDCVAREGAVSHGD